MAALYSPVRSALPIAILFTLQFSGLGLAQQSDVNGKPYETEEQLTGCSRLAALPPLPSARVVSCQKSDSVEVSMPLKPDANGHAKDKKVRGAYEFREYRIKEQASAFDTLLDALPMAGFIVMNTFRPASITARNGDTWILINLSDDFYDVSVVHDAHVSCAPPKDVDQMSHDMQVNNRIVIYGLKFSPENQIILPNSFEILTMLLKYLRQNSDLQVFIESHKLSIAGTELEDFEITRTRANAVVDWLYANGIPASCLQAKPFGGVRLSKGDKPLDFQCNDTIEISKAAK